KDLPQIGSVRFAIDYDDAFVAFLNGQEIARSAGLSDARPAYNQPSTESHEAVLYQGGVPDSYPVDLKIMRQGDNVLAVQVHNQSATSTDMSAIPFLFAGILDATHHYQQPPNWFFPPFEFESSNIPIVIIDTQGQSIQNEPKIMARMSIINNGPGVRNHLTDAPNEYDAWIGIETRGNASQMFEKKPYSFETRNEDGSNNDVKLLGMPKDNDWILNSAFIDRTLMRDAVAYHMSRAIGRWAPRTRHVELVLNGQYQGIYMIVEKIKPDKNRLNIAKLDTSDIAGDAVTGGYIWDIQQADETDVVFGNNGNSRVLKYPKPDEVQPQQLDYIRQTDDALKALVDRSYFSDPVRGYSQYIDVASFIDELLVQEATKNSDAYGWSGFFHKDRLGKICAGPVWDFDQAISNSTYNEGDIVEMWIIEDYDGSMPRIWLKLWQDKAFKEDVANKWFEYRSSPLKTANIFAFVDSVAAYLDEAQQRNFTRWPILGVFLWRETEGYEKRNTFQKEVAYMKQYLDVHMEWMDSELAPFTKVEDEAKATVLEMSSTPNPFVSATDLTYSLSAEGFTRVSVYNVLGQLVRTLYEGRQLPGIYRHQWDGLDRDSLPVAKGLYFYVMEHQDIMQTMKIVKF
ncbi:MAG: T9SS C-terminal target domain-containing protein, partial [Calditrichaeota bacterium]